MFRYSIYKQPPLPRCLTIVQRGIPHKTSKFQKPHNIDHYTMIDTKEKKCVGYMITSVEKKINHHEVYPFVEDCDSLYIEKLFINEDSRRKGYGSEFLKLAQTESRNQNCKGRVHLIAAPIFNFMHPPHIFYRKNGFTTTNIVLNDIIDHCINTNNERFFESVYMYLPIGDKIPDGTFIKIKKFFTHILERIKKQ